MDLAALPAPPPGLRAHPLDGALLWFDPRRGVNVRIDGPATRSLRRSAPRTILFGITNRCNLACEFCSRDRTAASAWDESSAYAALVEFAGAGALEVAFGGGEPLAFRGFDRLVERLRRDTALALHVTTNGALLSPARADRLAPLLGELRLSIYEDTPWPAIVDRAIRAGAQVGANLLCSPAALAGLPALLRRLADRGVHDVALLRYVGDDPALHLDDAGEARLAALIHESPLRARISTCFGDRLHGVPRLHGGGPGGCGAGSEFLTITSDRRLRACSFHHDAIPFTTVDDALAIYRRSQRRLAEPAARRGCARPGSEPAPLADGIRIWRGFGGNNSGDCVLVGRFADDARAAAFMAELLPGYAAGRPIPASWQALLVAEGIDPARGYSPDTMASLGSVVMMHTDMTLADDFVPLAALLWRRGGRAVLRGQIHHLGLEMLAGVRPTGDPSAGPELLARAGVTAIGRHADMSFGTAPIGGPAGTPHSVATRAAALGALADAGVARVAAELVDLPSAAGAGARALARLAHAASPEWLWARFDHTIGAVEFARAIAPDLRAPPAVASSSVLARFDRLSPRLGWLAARQGGRPILLQGPRLRFTLQVSALREDDHDEVDRFVSTLRAFTTPDVAMTIDRSVVGGATRLAVTTDAPLAVLAAIDPAIQAAGVALAALRVAAVDAIPAALSRLVGDLRRRDRR